MSKKTAVLLINLGTPDSPETRDVRSYLTQFLNDPYVIDINPVGRFFLVNGIIVPFRAPKSAKVYQELWDMWGGESPLLTYGLKLKQLVQDRFSESDIDIHFGMRYKNPSVKDVVAQMEGKYEKIIILPLFPHYATSTSQSAIDYAMKFISKWKSKPEISIIQDFFRDKNYIDSFVERGLTYHPENYDHILFSYHGLPERHVEKLHPELKCSDCDCPVHFREDQVNCYRNQCYETSRLIAEGLGISKDQYTVAFQSRLGKTPWLQPYSDSVMEKLAEKGIKKILAFSPAFIADCLETSIEIGVEYQELFEEKGGEKIQLVESLNDSDTWIKTVEALIRQELQ